MVQVRGAGGAVEGAQSISRSDAMLLERRDSVNMPLVANKRVEPIKSGLTSDDPSSIILRSEDVTS